MRITSVALLVAVAVGGCSKHYQLSEEVEQSKAAYKACLANNPSDSSPCASLKATYEANKKALNATPQCRMAGGRTLCD